MGRAKLRMELIAKEKTRITTYQKRKLGIIKKASEFTILCDVDTVMIITPPNSNEPEVWPENPDQIRKGIASYKSKKGETGKRTYNLNDFFEDRKKKIEDELMKARRKNMEAKYSTWFDALNSLPEHHLRQFVAMLEGKERDARDRLEFKKRNMNIIYPYMLNFGNKPSMLHFAGLGLGLGLGNTDPELMNPRHMPMNREPMAAYGYPLVDYGGNVYDNNLNNSFLSFQQQPHLVQGGMLSEFEPQEHESHVSNGGAASDYVTDDRR
ncbi:transcription factor, MADS-box [Artemisia annua]|uniref:Transcription factor, MADS-box n=1 Tax=Artemisia annua TaxID=35608 RepID=A0A2U1NTN9_ARTAN|nr:transcription factor, MADS-box [Artemisia annua]